MISDALPSGQRFIRTELTWSSTRLEPYTDSSLFRVNLTLNNSDDSKLGPGIYLRHDVIISGTLPGLSGGSADLLPIGFRANFYFQSDTPLLLQPLTAYTAVFTSDPGTAAQDNAEIQAYFRRTEPDCSGSFCGLEVAICDLQEALFSIEPIPGTYPWPTLPNQRCSDTHLTFIPAIFHRLTTP